MKSGMVWLIDVLWPQIRKFGASLCVLVGLNLLCGPLFAADLGLTVNSQGVLMRNGAPYRGIGVNYYDAFLRNLRDPNDDSYKAGIAELGAHGIPFARFAAGGYVANDYQLYLTDKEAYFQRLDNVVRAAEKAHVGLIPSLFWSISAISDVVNEPRSGWANGRSKTREFMRRYTRDVVSRYVNSPAIFGWEFSNELSLPVDMRAGTVKAGHELSYNTFRDAALDFAQVVRQIDPNRMILTGDALPRTTAYHNASFGPVGPDTEKQFARVLLRDNPGPFSPICIHASQANIGRYFADHQVSFQELLETCMQIGESARKPLYLEEFIPIPDRFGSLEGTTEREYFSNELAAIENSHVPLASIWVYDRKLMSGPFNVTFDNERSYMLQMISDFDHRVHAQE